MRKKVGIVKFDYVLRNIIASILDILFESLLNKCGRIHLQNNGMLTEKNKENVSMHLFSCEYICHAIVDIRSTVPVNHLPLF